MQDKGKEKIRKMFNNIAPKYDFLNHFLSAGLDIYWRRKFVKSIKPYNPRYVLDLATGTADLAIKTASLNPESIIGIDISETMLKYGRKKIEKKKLDGLINLIQADSESLPFDDESFDTVIVGFGIRNFEHIEKALAEIRRVLKKRGVFAILEFSKPEKFPVKNIY